MPFAMHLHAPVRGRIGSWDARAGLVLVLLLLVGAALRSGPALAEAPASILDSRMESLAGQLTGGAAAKGPGTLAVTDFSDLDGKTSRLCRFLSEELTTQLFRTGRFRIIERQRLEQVMKEQEFGLSGQIEPGTAARLGRVLGATAIVTGSVVELKSEVRVNARLIDSSTATVLAVASVQLPMDPALQALSKEGAGRAGNGSRFDGVWDVALACPPTKAAAGYTSHLRAQVKDGILSAQLGTVGVAPCTTLRGRIDPDGSAVLYATGLTGDPKYSDLHHPKGSPFSFHIQARFTATDGTGRRTDYRPCDVTFVKLPD